jgi:hypothetical protein
VISPDQGLQSDPHPADACNPARAPAGAKLTRAELDDLEWFFGIAPAMLERSTAGGILDALENMSPFQIMQAGHQYGRPKTEKVYGTKGSAFEKAVIGHRDGTTARPMSEYRNAKGVEPDDAALKRFARISRSVCALAAVEDGERHVAVLKVYFGDAGNVWEHLATVGGTYEVKREVDKDSDREVSVHEEPEPGTAAARLAAPKSKHGETLSNPQPAIREAHSVYAGHRAHGRIGSLYALTRGGRLVLEIAARRAKKKGQPFYDFGDQVRLQVELRSTSMSTEQTALVGRARREATALFVSACFAWNRVRAGEEQ